MSLPNSTDDISRLSDTSDESILSFLRDRFLVDSIYTRVGASSIVALNPLKYLHINSDKVLHDYALEYRQTDNSKPRLPPHIFQVAADAYYYMRRSAKDNALIMKYVLNIPYSFLVLSLLILLQ